MSGLEPDVFPVASGQQRMWFLARMEPDLAVYNVNLWLPMRPGCDPPLVRAALEGVIRRHESLRTSFTLRQGSGGEEVAQLVHAAVTVSVAETDLRALPRDDAERRFQRIARADAARPFDMAQPPLWRARLVWLTEDDVRLVWICDHTIFDGASSDIFVREFFACYDALSTGRPPDLPELPIQFADYAVWQRERQTADWTAGELAYWRETLADLPAEIGLPADRPRPAVRSYHGEVHQFALSPEVTTRVEAWARQHGVTSFMTLLAAFKTVLSRWSGQADVFVGCPMAGRVLPELEPLIGMFVNAVVVRTDLAGDPSFADVAGRVRGSLLEALEHQEVPFERIVEDVRPTRDLSRPPLYQVAFNLVPSDTRGQIANGTVKVDLALDLNVRDGRLHGRLEYATDLFDTATVKRLAEVYGVLLEAALRDPEQPISRLPLLRTRDRADVLRRGHGESGELATAVVPDLLDAQRARTPHAVAVVSAGEQHTFAQVHEAANRLADRLSALGIGPDRPVGVCVERSVELVVAVLAVLRAGGVLVPLDPEYPRERLAFQLADAGATLLLTQRQLRGRFGEPACPMILLDEPPDEPPDEPLREAEPRKVLHPDNAAYVLYTSGSTGRPKGVVTSHRALVNRLEWTQRRFGIDAGDAVLHKTSAGFDVSLWELLWPLATGATLVLAEPGGHRDPNYLRDQIVDSGVTTVHFVPSMLDAFLSVAGIDTCGSLRRIICSGEEVTRAAVDRCAHLLPGAQLHNLYGPTEAAIDVSAWRCLPGENGPVPIGHPVLNSRLHVLDRWLEPVPVGFPGDLHIGGVQLARGYQGQPAKTAAAFLPDPHGPAGSRLYRTGDLARVRGDGAIEFLGRADGQVKVHGVRVELGEIEGVLSEHPQVRQAVAAVRVDAPGGRGLVAYVDWAGDPGEAVSELRAALSRRLPMTMMPQAFVLISTVPSLPSGKVDRAALPSPQTNGRNANAEHAPPRTPIEQQLCTIWTELLGRDNDSGVGVGVDDDFFELGGHSLLAVRLIGCMQERFGVTFPLRRCFEITTVAEHALEILALRLGDDADDLLAAVENTAES